MRSHRLDAAETELAALYKSRSKHAGVVEAAPIRLVHDACVCAQGGLPTEVRVEHIRVARYLSPRDEVDQARHRLPLIHGVGDHPLEPPGETYRFKGRCVWDSVRAGVVAIVEDDLVVAQLASEPDQLGRVARDTRDLRVRFGGRGGAVDPNDAALALLSREAGDHPCLRAARNRADD